MAMRLGGGKGGNGRDHGDEDFGGPDIVAEINVTPLVDIFLLLLVIFMVTSSVISPMNIPVQLPQSTQAANAAAETATVIVTVNSTSEIYVNGKATVGREALGVALKEALEKSADKTVILEGDRNAVLGTIVAVMDEGKKAGATKFAMAAKGDGE